MFIRARVFASMSGALAVVALTVPWCVVVEVVTWMTMRASTCVFFVVHYRRRRRRARALCVCVCHWVCTDAAVRVR